MGTHHRRQAAAVKRQLVELRRWWRDRPVRQLARRLRPGLAPELYGGPLGAPWLSRTAGRRVLRPLPTGWAARVAARLIGGLLGPFGAFAVAMNEAAEQMAKAFKPMADEMAKLRVQP